jgi:hypothetical protein
MKTTFNIFLALMILGIFQQCIDADLKPNTQLAGSKSLIAASKRLNTVGHAFTLQPSVLEDYTFGLGTTSPSARISIAWGDGTVTPVTITSSYQDIEHTYTYAGSYFDYTMRITGDLNKITFFSSYYGSAQFTSIDFKALTKLEEISIGLTPAPSIIDLSHNHKLVKISLIDLEDVQSIILPRTHNLSWVDLFGLDLTTADVDGVIDNIYKNTLSKKITNGTFGLAVDEGDENAEGAMMGPPSTSSLRKLRELQDSYGWTIHPALP